ncbi:hypothetical protein V8B97DRAFT_876507 [Scleroderma yunnanense]
MTTTMHFGPEWMRAKPQTPGRQHPPPSPPLQTTSQSTMSTYSSLVTSAVQEQEKHDESRPFRYTKEEMLRIYKEGGGKGGLGLEVERWEGIVREVGSEPASLREMDETEKKLFAGPLNSEIRRRQSTDLINTLSSPSDRSRLIHTNSGGSGPARDRFGISRRGGSTDQPVLMSRKLSLSTTQGGSSTSPRETPRNRMGAFGSGFDGVLSNGDSWSRRRPSVNLTGPGGSPAREDEKDEALGRTDIKEEDNPTSDLHGASPTSTSQQPSLKSPDIPSPDNDPSSALTSDSVTRGIADMSVGEPNSLDQDQQSSTVVPVVTGPPPGLTDPSSIEWSYLDPQGQEQGPFRADVMQKWFDEGYFTPDLPMRRTHLDSDWVPVGVLERRANGAKIFLVQPTAANGPPGLTLRTESLQSYSPTHDHSAFNGYQPVPQRAIRSATLDTSYLNNMSPADSPSSSLGGGRFSSGSPDTSVFSGRAGNSVYSGDPNFGGRGLSARAPFQDSIVDPRLPFSNSAPGMTAPLDTYGNHTGASPWSTAIGPSNQGFSGGERHPFSNGYNGMGPSTMGPGLSVNQVCAFNQESINDAAYSGMGSLTGHHDSPLARQAAEVNGLPFNSSVVNGFSGSQYGLPSQSQYSQTPSAPYSSAQQHQIIPPFSEVLTQVSGSPHMSNTPTSAVQPSNSTLPWADPSPIRRTRTFDTPGTSPIVPPAHPQQGSNWARPNQSFPMAVNAKDQSPWLTASLGGADDVWKEVPGPNSLTFSNLGQHNKLHEQEEEETGMTVSPIEEGAPIPTFPQTPTIESTAPIITSKPTIPASSNTDPQVASKPKSRSTVRDVQASLAVQKAAPPPTQIIVKGPSPTPVAPAPALKSVWSTDDESKKVKPAIALSLREIQEAEAKKAEARKAAEKDRERLARANTTTATASNPDDPQSFTTSWGLPTSQTGARNNATARETPTSTPVTTTPSGPVWINTAPTSATKKSMKEIQEEEERWKKVAVKESVATAASRRAYAETAFKVMPSAQSTSGGAWTTVGANGKPSTPAAAPSRPAMPPPASTVTAAPPAAGSRQNGIAVRPAPAVTAAPPKPAPSPRVEDFPITPSHDFLKWLSDSLKGLNSSVNFEEITSMLLSFPLDPDPSTIEIISDLIYANSTTLDGRRFASEYVSKRKTDASARRGINAAGNGSKPVSIADVVKTQPKPTQQEWGFKVVNKKKRSGRS